MHIFSTNSLFIKQRLFLKRKEKVEYRVGSFYSVYYSFRLCTWTMRCFIIYLSQEPQHTLESNEKQQKYNVKEMCSMVLYFCMSWVLNNMEVKNEDITIRPLMLVWSELYMACFQNVAELYLILSWAGTNSKKWKNQFENYLIVIGKILHEMKIIIFQSIIIHLFYHLNIL